MKKSAFTMLELVMVIVVLGILAALAIPRFDDNRRQDAADNILSAIRYTQHLALTDNKNDRTGSGLNAPVRTNWQRGLWHIRFGSYDAGAGWFYTISSSRDGDANVDVNEVALEPSDGKSMYHLAGDANIQRTNESQNIFITNKYGVSNVDFTNCLGKIGKDKANNAATHVAFDYVGRPHKGIYTTTFDSRTVMHADCTIRFRFVDYPDTKDVNITILKETGYAFIVGQPDS